MSDLKKKNYVMLSTKYHGCAKVFNVSFQSGQVDWLPSYISGMSSIISKEYTSAIKEFRALDVSIQWFHVVELFAIGNHKEEHLKLRKSPCFNLLVPLIVYVQMICRKAGRYGAV